MAHTDFLTGLLTQRTFYEALEKEWHRSTRLQLPLSCVMMDLDFFKQINDVYGHPAGDSVLKFVAELLLGQLAGQRHRLPLRRRGVLHPLAGDRRERRRRLGRARRRGSPPCASPPN